jgi:hypothetical protein
MQKLFTTTKWCIALFVLCLSSITAFSQLTTASMNGLVVDEKGQPVPGATVVATHVASATKYGVSTREDGRYSIPNLRVGGPYTINVSSVGYQAGSADNIFLDLGQKFVQNFKMTPANTTLSEVVVKADPTLNSQRTGAAATFGTERLSSIPNITRSQEGFLKQSAIVSSDGFSIAGRNSQFNNYSLDGAIFNNPFGLDAARPGGQTGTEPVSPDAIEQLQLAIAPFDVTQSGFTGGSVNIVTKSGTNDFKGSAYTFFRNQALTGGSVDKQSIFVPDLSQSQYGFALGGPVIKNKVFFFANFEIDRRSDLSSSFIPARAGLTGSNISRVQASDFELISGLLKSEFGYNPGAYENFSLATNSAKGIFKLDMNLNLNHKLTFTYNYLDASKDKPAHPSAIGRRGPDFFTLQFQNAGYRINNKLNQGILELKSNFSKTIANKLQVGYSSFRDNRDPASTPFPVLNFGKDGIRYIIAGHEPFSINNVLSQDVLQINEQLNIFAGKHTITLGGALESFAFDNSFNLTGYGARVFFPDIDIKDAATVLKSAEFKKEVADAKAAFDKNNKENSWALAETNMGQLSFFAQDELQVNPNFTVTLGLRMDMPLYFDTPTKVEESIKRNCCYDPSITYYDEFGKALKFDSKVLPASTPLWSPRIGFNYDLKGDKTQQLRGGTGLFTGRFPFVWVGNQVANPNFFFYTITDPNFKYPQVWRTNLGYDMKTASGWLFSADFLYTKDINAAIVKNYGIKPPTGKLTGIDNRPIYVDADRSNTAYVFTNTDLGRSLNLMLQASKTWTNGTFLNLGYNYLDSQDAASIQAEISSDAYDRNPANIQHTNRPVLAPSVFGNRHRITGSFGRKFVYAGGKLATSISVAFQYSEGNRYSFTYSGDINGDGSGLNDLLFIPTDAQIDQMAFGGSNVSAQRSAFKAFIAQDPYLSANRGKYAEKYGDTSPWYNTWDLGVVQDFNIKNGNRVSLYLNVLNIGNLISSSWGVYKLASVTSLMQPLGVSVANGVPTYSFDTALKQTFQTDFGLASRWQAQIGLRYSFGGYGAGRVR